MLLKELKWDRSVFLTIFKIFSPEITLIRDQVEINIGAYDPNWLFSSSIQFAFRIRRLSRKIKHTFSQWFSWYDGVCHRWMPSVLPFSWHFSHHVHFTTLKAKRNDARQHRQGIASNEKANHWSSCYYRQAIFQIIVQYYFSIAKDSFKICIFGI